MKFSQSAAARNASLIIFFLAFWISVLPVRSQDTPAFKIDESVTHFAFSSNARLAFAVRHVFSEKKIQLQRDDIWIADRDGKRRRILQGEKLVRGTLPFSYTVRGLQWSPDGSRLTVELATSEMINDDGDTRDGVATLLLDDTGRELQVSGGDSLLTGAGGATWLPDGANVAYLTEFLKPAAATPKTGRQEPPVPIQPLDRSFSMTRVNVTTGNSRALFAGRLFSAVSWNVKRGDGIAIERSPETALHPRLVQIDPGAESSRDLATLDGYAGGLEVSPSGKKVAYWIDNGQLEVRDTVLPTRMARIRVAVGLLAWSGDETRILVKRGAAARTGDLVWIAVPAFTNAAGGAMPAASEVVPQAILHDLEFRQFDISADGKLLAVIEPGKRNLLVYALP
jgi:dipeptidyl aminopeptidase/acylaminoacyl peptidase